MQRTTAALIGCDDLVPRCNNKHVCVTTNTRFLNVTGLHFQYGEQSMMGRELSDESERLRSSQRCNELQFRLASATHACLDHRYVYYIQIVFIYIYL
jgi:hypothetical protein